MRFVIDSNEYIFAFGSTNEPAAKKLFERLLIKVPRHIVRIPRTIFEEVKRNISAEAFQEFNELLTTLTQVDEDIVVPFEVVFRYEQKGLKPADAFIAAYTEWAGADILATENRHFLSRQSDLPFKVLTAERCLKLI